jgi:hypothetical protein
MPDRWPIRTLGERRALRNGVLVHGEDSCGTCSRFARKSTLDRSVAELDEIVAV